WCPARSSTSDARSAPVTGPGSTATGDCTSALTCRPPTTGQRLESMTLNPGLRPSSARGIVERSGLNYGFEWVTQTLHLNLTTRGIDGREQADDDEPRRRDGRRARRAEQRQPERRTGAPAARPAADPEQHRRAVAEGRRCRS